MMISIIIGFGLATLFRKTCSLRSCYTFKGPPLNKIDGKTFKSGDKCYKYNYEHQSCKNTNRKIIDFSTPISTE